MIKYPMIGTCFKLLSSNKLTMQIYRELGNTIGQKRRMKAGLSQKHIDLGNELVALLNEYCGIKSDDRLLELGTGWLHWFAVFTKIVKDVKITLFDVWDNRQLGPLKLYVSQLNDRLLFEKYNGKLFSEKAINDIMKANSFEELYQLLQFEYIIRRDGNLINFPENQFNIVFSVHVFEHVRKEAINKYIKDVYRILKPGGYSVHIIDMADHYYHMLNDNDVSVKEYLKYSEKHWKLLYENKIQYINRIQLSEWTELFKEAGFKEIYSKPCLAGVNIKIHPDYKNLNENDINCYKLNIVHRKE